MIASLALTPQREQSADFVVRHQTIRGPTRLGQAALDSTQARHYRQVGQHEQRGVPGEPCVRRPGHISSVFLRVTGLTDASSYRRSRGLVSPSIWGVHFQPQCVAIELRLFQVLLPDEIPVYGGHEYKPSRPS
jgi:hypothetical protein